MANFRKFKKKDIRQIAKLKNSVFKKFNSLEYFNKSSVKWYLSFTDLNKSDEALMNVFHVSKESIFFVAEEEKKIVGYIKGNSNMIVNLFVLGNKHKKGLGRKLVLLFEKEAKRRNSRFIKIKSSLYAVPFYQKMGYKKTTGIRSFHGLKIQPMKKIIVL